jgi:hypothetical protein
LGIETACTDNHDNDCDSKFDRLDPTTCGVETTAISVSNPCPDDGSIIDISCTSSVGSVNCIGAWVDYNGNNARDTNEDCTWTEGEDYWSGNNAIFVGCSAGSKTNTPCKSDSSGRKAECYIQTDKCVQVNTNKSTYIDVMNNPCANHDYENTCNNDPKCKWARPCYLSKFYQFIDKPLGTCINKDDNIIYNCKNDTCGATCDGSVGCPPYLSSDTCYYGRTCDDPTCTCTAGTSAYCPEPGTTIDTTCYYGSSRICRQTGCSLNTCLRNGALVCNASQGCVPPPPSDYKINVTVYITNKLSNYAPGTMLQARVKASAINKNTMVKAYDCDSTNCAVNSIRIHTSTGWRNYITENSWDYRNNANFDSMKKEWKINIDTTKYRSEINVTVSSGGLEGSGGDDYTVTEEYILQLTTNFPDVDNYLVPKTPTNKPNFTMTMPLRFFTEVKRIGLLTTICESPECTATYGIDGVPLIPMTWDAYEKKFYASYDTSLFPSGWCNKYHMINISASDSVSGLTNTSQSDFFLSCTPSITAFPLERRLVIGDSSRTVFNITIWNPQEAAIFDIEMKNTLSSDDFVLNWLAFDCHGELGCTANNDAASLSVGQLSSKTIAVELSSADRSGSYSLTFTSTKQSTGETYKILAYLLVFSESLPEFSAAYLVALFTIAAIIFIYNRNSITPNIKRKR